MPLQSAAEQYQRQRRLAALAVRDARKVKSDLEVAQVVNRYQLVAADVAANSVPEMLAEQGIPDAPVGRVNPHAFMSGASVADMAGSVATDQALDRLVATLVQDAGRSASSVAVASRPNVTAHVRYLNPPSCSRCAVLAGRVYRWSDGFQRHPKCDCVMVPTTIRAAPGLISDPLLAFERGQIRGLSVGQTRALEEGADVSRVINVNRGAAGLDASGATLSRGGRLTPDGVYTIAKDRDEAIDLLRANGYLTRPRPAAITPPKPKAKFGKTVVDDSPRARPPLKGEAPGKPMSLEAYDDAPSSRSDSDFRLIADPDERATAVLQYQIEMEQAAKQAARNLAAGRDALDGIDYEAAGSPYLFADGYELADLRADIVATGQKLLDWAPTEGQFGTTVYKGVQFEHGMDADQILAALNTDGLSYSSVTAQRWRTEHYAGRPRYVTSVVVEIEDGRGIWLNSVGNHCANSEGLLSGDLEILSIVQDAEGRWIVKARQR